MWNQSYSSPKPLAFSLGLALPKPTRTLIQKQIIKNEKISSRIRQCNYTSIAYIIYISMLITIAALIRIIIKKQYSDADRSVHIKTDKLQPVNFQSRADTRLSERSLYTARVIPQSEAFAEKFSLSPSLWPASQVRLINTYIIRSQQKDN